MITAPKAHITGKIVPLLTGAIAVWAAILLLPITYVLHFSLDDSYFYLKTALHFAQGHGSTFDGINPTNGYHPLWFFILAGFYKLILLFGQPSPELLYRLTFILTTCITGVSFYFIDKFLDVTWQNKPPAFMKPAVFILLAVMIFVNFIGFELQVGMMVLSALLFFRTQTKNLYVLKGLLLGLLCLARIDYTFLLVPLLLWFEIRDMQRLNQRKNIFLLFMFPLAFMSLYVAMNYHFFGRPQTTSSYIEFKPAEFLLLKNLLTPLNDPIRFGFLVFGLLSGLPWFFVARKVPLYGKPAQHIKDIALLWIAGFIFIVFHMCFNISGAREWYFGVFNLCGILLFAHLFSIRRKLSIMLFSASAAVLVLYLTVFRINYYNFDDAYNYALLVKKNTPENAVIYQFDLCGFISFYSERNVINGDGLINSFEYIECLKADRLAVFFGKHPYDFYSTYSFSPFPTNGIFSENNFYHGTYSMQFHARDVVVTSPRMHGGIFRKKFGTFYLFRNVSK